MPHTMRIGIIGGAGWLGGAIASSLLASGIVRSEALSLSYRSARPTHYPHAHWTQDNQEVADRSDVIIISVRPADWSALAFDSRGKLIISVMAGIRLDQIATRHRTRRAVRALPNAAAEVAGSYTPWFASAGVSEADRAAVREIFSACGVEDEVRNESSIDYFTGLTGAGPAFPALLAAAMVNDAIRQGIPDDVARRAVTTVLVGTGRLLEQRQDCPNDIVASFLDYRGTTAAAIDAMRSLGFDEAVAEGLSAAAKKSVSMGDTS
ncbi:pyrroline-5-carboxylate reductase [Phyllobacterium phragmitis]|uniref:Pyrroline-5-carboxylate reductase n=1 Tax=Phyllobacterium phragmitis TaxID=2670329 RepID=A0A2S9IXT7_9HYPH|nr:pyrroline-5-carboxylate reductase dimerization domain-containing protein [Phyllobacterium phragmitis]PRD45343.1 pyrroline-5-carboxylate reductase [Phyllobacterium phragmitis]